MKGREHIFSSGANLGLGKEEAIGGCRVVWMPTSSFLPASTVGKRLAERKTAVHSFSRVFFERDHRWRLAVIETPETATHSARVLLGFSLLIASRPNAAGSGIHSDKLIMWSSISCPTAPASTTSDAGVPWANDIAHTHSDKGSSTFTSSLGGHVTVSPANHSFDAIESSTTRFGNALEVNDHCTAEAFKLLWNSLNSRDRSSTFSCEPLEQARFSQGVMQGVRQPCSHSYVQISTVPLHSYLQSVTELEQ